MHRRAYGREPSCGHCGGLTPGMLRQYCAPRWAYSGYVGVLLDTPGGAAGHIERVFRKVSALVSIRAHDCTRV